MGNEDRKVLKQNVGSMPRDNEKEIEIHGGAGEIGIKVVKVTQWKNKCKSYFNRYYKTSNIIMVPSDQDKIMNALSFLCSNSKGRGFIFKNYDIVKHLEFLGYTKVSLKANLGAAPTTKSTSYIAYIEQNNVIFICEKVSKVSNIHQCLKNITAMVKYFLTLYNREIQGTRVTVVGLLIRENGSQEGLVECSFCNLFSPLYEFFESSTVFKAWWKFIETYEGWWNFAKPNKRNKLFNELAAEILCFMSVQEKGLPTLTDDQSQQFKQTYFLYTPQQMNILFSEAKHVVIQGSYGSGKSILGLKKLELIWKSRNERNEKIIYINFDRRSNLHFVMEKNVKEYVGISSRKIHRTTGIQDILESPGRSIYVCHNSSGKNLSAILQETMRLNKSTLEMDKTNYHLIIEEYDGETLSHDEAAKITKLVKSTDLIESNIVLLAQPLMKNRSWNIGKKRYERETCMFHELKDIFKILRLEEVLRCSNEICEITKCTQDFIRNKDSVFKTKMDKLTFEQWKQPEDSKNHRILPSLPELNYHEVRTLMNGKISNPSNDSSKLAFEQRQQPKSSKRRMISPNVPELNYLEMGISKNGSISKPSDYTSEFDKKASPGMDLDQAFKTSTPVKKSNAAKSKIVSKFGFICEPKSGVDIEGLKPKLFKFSEHINLTSDVAVIALASVLGDIIDKNETTSILHIADRQPWLLRRAIKLLPKVLDESFSYTKNIEVYLEKTKQSKMIFISNLCRVNGMEFDHVIIVVSQSEYYLKHYLPQAISRCTYDLTFILLSKDTTVIKKDSLQKLSNFFSRSRNCDSKETVADIIEELQRGSLVEQMIVAECKACKRSCYCYSISKETHNKQMFEVHTHSDQCKDYFYHLANYTEFEEQLPGTKADALADAK